MEEIVRETVRTGQVLGIRISSVDEGDNQPWTRTPSKRLLNEPALSGHFPSNITLVLSNLIYVEKSELSSSLVNKIKRLSAFQNPEFYKKQQLRLSTALTPRVICCAEEFPQHIGIPRGCLDELRELLVGIGIKSDTKDERFYGTKVTATFHGQLTSVQKTAAEELLNHDFGILVAPSGSGKTVVGISLIASRGVNTLVLVNRLPLMEQWRAQLANFLQIDISKVGQIGGGKDKRSGYIDVAMLQSLIKNGQVQDVVAEYGQVIIDECHHLPAITFEQVLRQVKAHYVIGLTATPYRRDGHQPIILMQCGPVCYEISQKDQKSQVFLQHCLICRGTNFTSPSVEKDITINELYAALVADEGRNKLILNDVLKSLDEGRSPILLTERREHLEYFAAQLTKLIRNVIVLHGGMGIRQRRILAEQIVAIPEGEKRILLATGRYIGEGFDDSRLDTLFLALPVSWKGTLVQYAGRLHRLYSGKTEVRIYDYVDCNVPILMRMFQRRLHGYKAIGYKSDDIKNSNKTLLSAEK